jgi:hypothetical protein
LALNDLASPHNLSTFANHLIRSIARLPGRTTVVYRALDGEIGTLLEHLKDYDVGSTVMWASFVSATTDSEVRSFPFPLFLFLSSLFI